MLLKKCRKTHSVRKGTVKSSSMVTQSPLVILDRVFLISRQHMHSRCVGRLSQPWHEHHWSGSSVVVLAAYQARFPVQLAVDVGCWVVVGVLVTLGQVNMDQNHISSQKIDLIVGNFMGSCASFLTVCNAGGAWTQQSYVTSGFIRHSAGSHMAATSELS